MSKRSLFIAAIVLAFAGAAQAATLTVTNTSDGPAPGPAGSLRRAISDSAPGDTINFALLANSTVNLTSGELLINKALAISGPGANLLSVQRSATAGTLNFRIFNIESDSVIATIAGLTIANGNSDTTGGGIRISGSTVNVHNSTISGNSARSGGGGISNFRGTVTVTYSTVSGNTLSGGNGGGISNGGFSSATGTLTITSSTISGNEANGDGGGGWGGGINNAGGTVTVTNSTISRNTSQLRGGGINNSNSGTLRATNTIIALNTSASSPDIYGPLTSEGFNLIGNNAGATITGTTNGNKLNVDPLLGPLQNNGGPTKTHALLSGSPAIEGGHSVGANTDQRGFARPVDSPGISNATGGDGSDIGASEVQADLLPGCNTIDRIVNNNNDSGAGSLRAVIANVCAGSTITFAANVRGAINLTDGELLIEKNLTISGPGANLLSVQRSAATGTPQFRIFYVRGAINVSISGLTIANGNVLDFGGGILNAGTLALTNSTISGNTVRALGGGGIDNGGTVIITNSTISGNGAREYGGGISNGGTVSFTNSTISGNTAFGGGGIYNRGTATLTNSTIAGNSSRSQGGGIYNSGGTLTARNTMIAGNTAMDGGPDVEGALTSQGYNLIGNQAGAFISPAQFSDQIGVTAEQLSLGPLQDNGGPTPFHALLPGSFAIDKGSSSGSFADQRGFSRPVDDPAIPNADGGDGGDIGAFEFGGAAASLKILSITRSGNGPVVLQVAGFPYAVHRIQASVDMSFGSFSDIATVTADPAGRFQYQSPVAGLANFYRVAFP